MKHPYRTGAKDVETHDDASNSKDARVPFRLWVALIVVLSFIWARGERSRAQNAARAAAEAAVAKATRNPR